MNHIEHIPNKLGVRTRGQIAAWAVQQGLVTLPKDRVELGQHGSWADSLFVQEDTSIHLSTTCRACVALDSQ
jgi:hypothetical protein